jgi:hypothetical protein
VKLKYTFLSGLPAPKGSPFLRRRVTVEAHSYSEAGVKARAELDRRCEGSNSEPPPGWDLELIQATPTHRGKI